MPTDPLSATFSALGDPTRRAILARLASGESSVNELAAPFSMSLPAISKHLKVLERAGLISRSQQAQKRPCKLEPEALKTAAGWLDDYRGLWEERLDRLEEYLQALQRLQPAPQTHPRARKQRSGTTGRPPSPKSHPPRRRKP